ncbi:MAG: hypothetical protein A6F71_08125 [Cycloclasticus sp. symbiont of Poecilosclerida sp. M]|nr:MAG: hypothetical protein A6F71_08125 [Cycloclasticus sp. symbiont of Poecilosclerida sp. M]
MLHIINKSCSQSLSFNECLKRAGLDDCILLIEDAVLCARSAIFEKLAVEIMEGVSLYVLKPDMQARGISEADCVKRFQPVDYAGFVALTVENNPVRSWL